MEISLKRVIKGILLSLVFLTGISYSALAQCTLGKGDLVFTGYDLQDDGINGLTQDDKFSFVLLRDVAAGTQIYFTDFGWTSANAFQVDAQAVSDGMILWTADKKYVAGTQIYIKCKFSLTAFDKNNAAAGVVTSVTESYDTRVNFPGTPHEYMSLGVFSGDQIFAFIGTPAAPTFLAGMSINHNNGGGVSGWDVTLSPATFAADESMLPAGLASGAQNLSIVQTDPTDPTFNTAYTARYKATAAGGGTTSGVASAIVTRLNNPANWEILNDGTSFSPFFSGETFTVTGAAITTQPLNRLSQCAGTGTTFAVVTTNACAYQWQVSTDLGVTFTNITNGGVYSGATSATLTISNVNGLGTYQYQAIVTGAAGPVTSTAAQLTLASQVITLAPSSLASGTYQTAYSQTLTPTGGGAPYVYSISAGTLPTGLTLSAAGVISGTPTAAGTSNFTVSVTGACISSGSQAFSLVIAQKPLTATFAAVTKAYDGTANANVVFNPLNAASGVVGADVVSVTYTSAAFSDATVANNKTISFVGLGLTGAASANYTLNTVTATGNITPAVIVPSLAGTITKTYDGTTTATLAGANYTFTGKVGVENVALNNPVSGTYDLKNVGSRTVTVTGLTLTGTDAANYTLSTTSVTAPGTITSATIVPTLAGTITKTYDGTTAATLAAGNYSFTGKVGTENVALNNPVSGTYDLKNAGSRTVTVTGLALTGTDAINYTLSTLSLTAPGTITSATITPTLAGTITKTYDGTTTATLAAANYSFTGKVGTENVALNNPSSGTYDLKNVGSRTVTVTGLALIGTDAINYTLSTLSLTAPGTITSAVIVPVLAGTITKVYDGTTTATLTAGNYSFSGLVGTENVALNNPAAGTYDLKTAGSRTVTVTGLALTGTDAANYTLSTLSLTAPGTITTATITPVLAGTITKVYDGNVTAVLSTANFNILGVIGTDAVTLINPPIGTYNIKDAGSRVVTAIGLSLSGVDAVNYTLSTTTVTAPGTITSATIIPVLAGTITKPYDGTTAATLTAANYSFSGLVGVENVTLNNPASGTYDLKTAGNRTVTVTGLALTGTDAVNYTISTTSLTAPGTITSATIVPVLAGTIMKVYDGTTTATLSAANYSFTGNIGADQVALNNPVTGNYSLKTTGNRTVTVTGLALTGTDAVNYTISTTSLTAPGIITAATITPVLAGTITKVYDGTTAATLSAANYSFTGNIGADVVTLNNPAAGTYDLAIAGNRTVAVTGLALTGTDAVNYTLSTTSLTAPGTITAATIVPVLAGTITKVYDGTTTATLTGANYSFTGNIGADQVTLNNPAAGTYDLKTAGNRTVTVAGLALTGTDAANYTISTTSLTAPGTITSATIIPVLAGTITKVYDGNTVATLSAANYSFTGNIGADQVALNDPASGTYDLKIAGNRTVTVTGLTLTGTDAANYSISTTSLTAPGTITAATIIPVLAGTITKVYDGNTAATLSAVNYSFTGNVGADQVALNDPASGTYDLKIAGNRTVTVTGLALTGTDAANYSISATSLTAPGTITSATITPVLAGTITKVYDGNTTATLSAANYSFTGNVGADQVALNDPASGTYDLKIAGNRTVTVTGLILTGTDAANYSISATSLTAPGTITSATIIPVLAGTITKVYDGNTTATLSGANYSISGNVGGDQVALNDPAAGTYDLKDAGNRTVTVTGLALTGTDAANYTISAASLTAPGTITSATITPVLAGTITKIYDGNTAATLSGANYSFTGNIGADQVALNNPLAGTYDLKIVGNRTVSVSGLALTGTDAANYSISTTSLTAPGTITSATIVPVLAGTITKAYDGTTTATLSGSNYSISGNVSGDQVALNNPVAGTYDLKIVGNRTVSVSGLALTGTDATNYTISATSLTAPGTITSATIVPVLAGTITKVYDGTTTATLSGANYSFTGNIGTDQVALNNPSGGTYDQKNTGSRTVTVNAVGLTGADAANYSISTTSLTAPGTITSASITPLLTGTITKVYDGSTTAFLNASNYSFSGQVGSENVALNNPAQGVYDNANVATGKLVTVIGLALTGTDAGNYVLTTSSLNNNTGIITAQPLLVTADNKQMIQGTTVPPLTITYTGFVNGETAAVLTTPVTETTTATNTSLAGDYPILVSGAAAANYAITYANGVLTIKPGIPTSITFTPQPLYQKRPVGAVAGTLSSTSLDPNATFTYTLVGGAGDIDNSSFAISGNQVVTAKVLNFKQQAVYSIVVRSTTQYGLTLDKQFNIYLNDVNEVPTLNAIADLTQCNTTSKQTIALSGITPGPETTQTTTLSVTSDNPSMFSDLRVSQGANGNGTLTYYLANNSVSGTARITVTVKDNGGTANGGVDTYSRTFALNINPVPVLSIISEAGTSLSKGVTTRLIASGGNTYVWANASGIIGAQNTAILTVRPTQTTSYTVTATNASGCSSTQLITIDVLDDYRTIDATNVLTPNGDGVNDKWVVRNIDVYPNNEVKIFDRAGRQVYSKKAYDNSWDGTVNGSPLSEGTYFYVIDFGDGRSKFKGFITLVRNN
ncbi:YDG domain-containing protein [Pedobacter cryoconitis]|uniref:Gliding motility-associated-like protein n=1 Tax=Pedobacter cryoconitis TaxID=188932 RepID=A0A7X0J7C7_9SPHI|nr:YDG domain-containing protein [Pedobacter cryoconitis]MBB6501999.1 gliding motility-associated-like protein [Pedobacter cryoconitis]